MPSLFPVLWAHLASEVSVHESRRGRRFLKSTMLVEVDPRTERSPGEAGGYLWPIAATKLAPGIPASTGFEIHETQQGAFSFQGKANLKEEIS